MAPAFCAGLRPIDLENHGPEHILEGDFWA